MEVELYFINLAKAKARTDHQDHKEAFLKGKTNGYKKDIHALSMYIAYEQERLKIMEHIKESDK